MQSCPECGTKPSTSANYCSSCGVRLSKTTGDPEREQFWQLIDQLVDVEIERLNHRTAIELAPGHVRDDTVFALKMYITGFVMGMMYVVLLNATREAEDHDFEDLDLRLIYDRITERINEQEARIEAAFQPGPD